MAPLEYTLRGAPSFPWCKGFLGQIQVKLLLYFPQKERFLKICNLRSLKSGIICPKNPFTLESREITPFKKNNLKHFLCDSLMTKSLCIVD
jgi:hypothetical protein